jgi:hypothetical protein
MAPEIRTQLSHTYVELFLVADLSSAMRNAAENSAADAEFHRKLPLTKAVLLLPVYIALTARCCGAHARTRRRVHGGAEIRPARIGAAAALRAPHTDTQSTLDTYY